MEKIKETAKKTVDESMDTYISLFQKKDPKLTKAEAEKLAKRAHGGQRIYRQRAFVPWQC